MKTSLMSSCLPGMAQSRYLWWGAGLPAERLALREPGTLIPQIPCIPLSCFPSRPSGIVILFFSLLHARPDTPSSEYEKMKSISGRTLVGMESFFPAFEAPIHARRKKTRETDVRTMDITNSESRKTA